MLGHRATTDGAAAERRLQVHRLPERPRLDVARLELEADVLARRAELLRRDEHARQPAVAGAVRRFGHERDARRGERAAVDGIDLAAPRELRGQRLELRAADRGEQVAEAVVEADVVVLIVRGGLARLRREMARALDDVAAVRHEHAAAARRDDLVAVEREGRALAERAGAAAAAGRAERFRGVLDHRHAVARADVEDARVVGALAVEIDGDDRGRLLPRARARGEIFFEQIGIERPRVGRDVHERRRRAHVGDRVGGRRERHRRGDDLVAAADAERDERQVQRGGAARQRYRVRHADRGGELALERVDVRPERRDPPRVERVEQQLALGRADVWRRQINAAHRPPSGFAGTPTTVTPGSTERVTHAPAPTTASSPMTSGRSSVPLMIEAPVPM